MSFQSSHSRATTSMRVDTRVVQIIYAIDPNHPLVRDNKILVGQLVDVFIDTTSPTEHTQSELSPPATLMP